MRWIPVAAIGFLILFLVASFAHAEPRGHGGHGGHGWGHGWGGGWWNRPAPRYDPGTAFWGGVVGGLAGTLFRPREPEVVVVQPQRDVSWCIQRYRSYDTYTRTYLGYDGLRHGCP